MIVVFGTVLCTCNQRDVTCELRDDDAPATAAAINAAQALALFVARLTAVARGWAVLDDARAVCAACLERPDVGTIYQDQADDWGRR